MHGRLLRARNVGPALRGRHRRFTLVEIAIVLAIAVSLVTFGLIATQNQRSRVQLAKAAKGMQRDLVAMRQLAVYSGRQTRFLLTHTPGDCLAGSSAGGRYVLQIGNRAGGSDAWDTLPEDVGGPDAQQDQGTVDLLEGQHRARNICLRRWDPLAGPSGDNADAIVFTPQGHLANPITDFGTDAAIRLTLVDLLAASQARTDEVDVVVSNVGHVGIEHRTDAP